MAIKDGNFEVMRREIAANKSQLDYHELVYGQTLLMLAISNYRYEATKMLLDSGANPNTHDTYDGRSPIIEAAYVPSNEGGVSFLKLLLEKGGNPNDEEIGDRRVGNTTRVTPLLAACSDVNQFVSPIEKVKLLVAAGAIINYKNEYDQAPLKAALSHDHFDVLLFLMENGADYNQLIVDRSQYSSNGKKVYIVDVLREKMIPLDDPKYIQKMAVVDFLKSRGIDYKSVPIPDKIKTDARRIYPHAWREYLDKY